MIGANENYSDEGISEAEGNAILEQDVATIELALANLLTVEVSQNQLDALGGIRIVFD